MTGICGWISFHTARPSSSETMTRMAASLTRFDRSQPASAAGAHDRAVLLATVADARALYRGKEGVAALFGDARLTDSALAARAREQGIAQTLLAGFQERGPAILDALRTILAGGVYVPTGIEQRVCLKDRGEVSAQRAGQSLIESLTPRQRAVLDLLARGKANKQIADELLISDWTVKAHISAILRKLGAQSRLEAVVIARRLHPAGVQQ